MSRHIKRSRTLALESLEQRRILAVGDLDFSFGGSGMVQDDYSIVLNSNDEVSALASLPDSGFCAGGGVTNGRGRTGSVWCFNAAGTPLSTFGTGGRAPVNGGEYVSDLAVLPDGKILVSGSARNAHPNPNSIPVLERLNADGTTDSTFGSDGFIYVHNSYAGLMGAIAVRSTGKIVTLNISSYGYQLRQFLPQGAADDSFSAPFINMDGSEANPFELLLLPDGSLIVATWVYEADSTCSLRINKHRIGGELDTSFGSDGTVTLRNMSDTATSSAPSAVRLTMTVSGNLVLAGTRTRSGSSTTFLYEMTTQGDPVTGFGQSGLALIDLPSKQNFSLHDIQGTHSGRIVLAGTLNTNGNNQYQVAEVYLTAGGILDTSVGQGGVVSTGRQVTGVGRTLLQGNSILYAGMIAAPSNYSKDLLVLRHSTANGSADTSFGNAGQLVVNSDTTSGRATHHDVVELDDKSILAIMSGTSATSYVYPPLMIAKYQYDGTPDKSYGVNGKLAIANTIQWYGMLPHRLIKNAFGIFVMYEDLTHLHILKLNNSGAIDTSFGIDGHVQWQPPKNAVVKDVVVTQNAFYVALDVSDHSGTTNSHYAVTQLDWSGQPTTTYGTLGTSEEVAHEFNVVTGLNIALQSDGGILLLGNGATDLVDWTVFVRRLDANGRLDPTFGASGTVITSIGSGLGFDNKRKIVSLPDDGFITVGIGGFQDEVPYVERYDAKGALVSAFGINGKLIVPVDSIQQMPFDVEIDSHERLVIGTVILGLPNSTLQLTRLLPNGNLDTEFAGTGSRQYALGRNNETYFSLTIASHDDILVAGAAEAATTQRAFLARIVGSMPDMESWSNSLSPEDVNGDRVVSALDALIVINELSGKRQGKLTGLNTSGWFFDVNSDGFLSGIDALFVINRLNRAASGEGEGGGNSSVIEPLDCDHFYSSSALEDIATKKRRRG